MMNETYDEALMALEGSVLEHMHTLEEAGLHLGERRGNDVLISATLLKTILMRGITAAEMMNDPRMTAGVALVAESVDAVIRTMAQRELDINPGMFDTPPET